MIAPLRILTVADVPPDPNSGAAGTVYYTNHGLRELGHDVDEVWAEDLAPRRIKHGNLHSLLEQPLAYRRVVNARVARKPYDVVQMSQPQAYLAARALRGKGFGGLLINRSHGVELRVDEVLNSWHRRLDVPVSQFPFMTGILKQFLNRQWHGITQSCDGIVVGSSLDRDYLINQLGIAPFRVAVISHGVEPAFFDAPLELFDTERMQRMLHVGQHAFVKGSTFLPAIINRVLAESQNASFTWVCSAAHHPEIREQLSADVTERVTLLDWMPIANLVKVYDRHGIFVFPSLFEGFGKAAFEAMSRGLCVIATDEGGMHDYIESGVNGWLCSRGDIDQFVGMLTRAVSQQNESLALGAAGIRIGRSLSWGRCAQSAVEFYGELEARRCA